MNERIRELLEQSLRWSGENVNRNLYSVYEIQQKEYEKFAELIVRECCDWIDGSPATDAGQLLLTKSFMIANLKGHFSVDK